MPRTSSVLDRVRKTTTQFAENLKRELQNIEEEKRRVTADLDEAAEQIRNTLAQLGHSTNDREGTRTRAAMPKAGKRIRRSLHQLKAEAEAIIALVKEKGAEGATGPEIRKHHPKIGPDIKGFVHKYSGKKLKSTGAARSMHYLVS